MAFQTHVAYYNQNEIDAIYLEQVNSKLEIEETREVTVTARILAGLGLISSEVRGDETKGTIAKSANQDLEKAVEVTRELIRESEIPDIKDLFTSESSYFQYSGEVDAYTEDGYDMMRIEGTDGDVKFTSHTSGKNWTSESYLARADSGDPETMNIDGIVYPKSSTPTEDGRYEMKFVVIYPGTPTFVV